MASFPARAVSDQAPAPVPVTLSADLPAHLAASLVTDLGAGDTGSTSSLAVALAAVPDAGHRRGRRHDLTGATSYVAISEWAAIQGAAVLDCLDDHHATGTALPCEATLRRCLQTTDAAALDAAVAGWAGAQLAVQQARAAGGQRCEPVVAG